MTGLIPPAEMPDVAALCASLYLGLAIGCAYDVFALLRLPFSNPVMIYVLDAVYCIFALCMAGFGLYYISCGTLRSYIFITMALGIYLYLRFPSRLFRDILSRVKKRVANK